MKTGNRAEEKYFKYKFGKNHLLKRRERKVHSAFLGRNESLKEALRAANEHYNTKE